jgi:hypothetical protein
MVSQRILRLNALTNSPARPLFFRKVHKGFWQAWSSVRHRIIDEVLALVAEGGIRQIFVTGR